MAEIVIRDESQGTGNGKLLFNNQPPRPFPGLCPISAKIKDQIESLERAGYELSQVRDTLLLNFGPTPVNGYGFVIYDTGSTINMLVTVLEHLAAARTYSGRLNQAALPTASEKESK